MLVMESGPAWRRSSIASNDQNTSRKLLNLSDRKYVVKFSIFCKRLDATKKYKRSPQSFDKVVSIDMMQIKRGKYMLNK